MKKNYKRWLGFLLLEVSLNCYASIQHFSVNTKEYDATGWVSKSAEYVQQEADDLIQEKLNSLGSSVKIDHIQYTILKQVKSSDGEHIRKIVVTVWYETP